MRQAGGEEDEMLHAARSVAPLLKPGAGGLVRRSKQGGLWLPVCYANLVNRKC